MGCRGLCSCWGVGQSPASTKFNERSGGKIPFRVIRSQITPFVPISSFSQEKLLTTHYHEPAHISHQWTCESVSGSHLRERSDAGRNTTHPLDPDKLTKMEPRVPSLHYNLKREQNPAFLVSRGSSYYPLCSTPRSRGRSAPMTSPRPWLMFSRKTTFAILRYLRLRHKVGVPLVQKNRSCKL